MKKLYFFIFLITLVACLAVGVFAAERYIEVVDSTDITNTMGSLGNGDTVTFKLTRDIELASTVEINMDITVNVEFNGHQIKYVGGNGADTTIAAFYVNSTGAVLNLKGSNRLENYKTYNHYGEDVKADLIGNGNLLAVANGTVSIKDAYLYANNNTFVIFGAFVSDADYKITVSSSVLRVNEGAKCSAICFKGGNANNNDVKSRRLFLDNCVEYGGFYGHNFSFNLTRGSSFNKVKFYDFYITNDCWYNPDNALVKELLMNSVEHALQITDSVFCAYNGELGAIKIKTETGKQNIRLYNCEFAEFVPGSIFMGDKGGVACVYVITEQTTCQTAGLMNSYESPSGTVTYYENKVVPAGGHLPTEAVPTYPNGYANMGVGVAFCSLCSEQLETDEVFEPLFVSLGYSINDKGDSLTLGTYMNKALYDAYRLTFGKDELEYGIVVGRDDFEITEANGQLSVKNGYKICLSEEKNVFFNLKITGFNDSNANQMFTADFYIFDGEETAFVVGNSAPAKATYMEISDSLDEISMAAKSLLESKHTLYYNEDGSFRIMVLADMHINSSSDTTTLKETIKTLVDKEQPNLVIFTGDNVIGASNADSLRKCLDSLVGYIEEKQIPWCHVYGNHDRERALSNEEQQEIYQSYKYCISKDERGVDGVGNYVHGIFNRDGSLGSVIYFLDSGTSNGSYGYDYITDNQIAWYKNTSDILKEYNGGEAVKGIMAFHIPLKENQYAYENRLNTDIVYNYTGDRYEVICPSSKDTNLFETILAQGDVKAIVTGHDHNNDYMYNYYGVKLCSAPTISKHGYSASAEHEGARIFDMALDTIDDVTTYVSYLIERVDAEGYPTFDSSVLLEGFGNDSLSSFEGTGYDSGNLSGTISIQIVDGKLEIVRSSSGNSEVNIYLDKSKYGKLGANKYLVVWVDFTNVDFRKACFGLLSTNGSIPYRTDDRDTPTPYYYLADGSSEWIQLSHGNDGCFGTAQAGSVNGMKGYLALPVENFRYGSVTMNENTLVTGIYFYGDVNSGQGTPFYFDDIYLVEDYTEITSR